MMTRIIITITLALSILIPACENDNEKQFETEGIASISYGTSFGECIGYCIKTLDITLPDVFFVKKGWEMAGSLPDSTDEASISQEDWDALTALIDFDEFSALDDIIGCPDCADGGAEWIEITYEEQVHKVTFEYYNEPETVKAYIGTLRAMMDVFD